MAAPLMERKGATGGEVQEGRLINGAATDHFPWLARFLLLSIRLSLPLSTFRNLDFLTVPFYLPP